MFSHRHYIRSKKYITPFPTRLPSGCLGTTAVSAIVFFVCATALSKYSVKSPEPVLCSFAPTEAEGREGATSTAQGSEAGSVAGVGDAEVGDKGVGDRGMEDNGADDESVADSAGVGMISVEVTEVRGESMGVTDAGGEAAGLGATAAGVA